MDNTIDESLSMCMGAVMFCLAGMMLMARLAMVYEMGEAVGKMWQQKVTLTSEVADE